MKRLGIKQITFAAVITLSLTVVGLLMAPKGLATADSCTAPTTAYGTDTMSMTIPSTGTYYIWTRMQAPTTSANEILLNIDNADCYDVGGSSSMTTGAWDWIDYSDGSTSSVIKASLTAGTHSLVLTGIEGGVSVDRIEALADSTCTPTSTGDNCTPAVDTTPPTATITSKPAAVTNSTSASFIFTGTDNVTATADLTYECSLDSAALGSCDKGTASYTGLAQGTHSFTVEAVDAAGNVSTPATYSWTIDTTPPAISISAPTSGSTVSGTVTVSATSSGAANVQYKLDGANLGSALTTSPFTYSWNTTSATNASHTLTAVATDAAGNTATSSTVTVTVNNSTGTTGTTPPSVPTGLAQSTATPATATTMTLGWKASTDGSGTLAGYKLYRNGTLIATLGSTTLSYLDTDLTVGTTYSYTIAAYDSAGNTSAQSSTMSAKTDAIVGDLDGDGVVTGHDVSLLLAHYNTNYPQGEFDGTATVEGHDVSLLLSNYGK
jgi:chitinase